MNRRFVPILLTVAAACTLPGAESSSGRKGAASNPKASPASGPEAEKTSSTKHEFVVVASCDERVDFLKCEDYDAAFLRGLDEETMRIQCVEDHEGKWQSTACPANSVIGRCTVSAEGGTSIVSYYPGESPTYESPEEDCKSRAVPDLGWKTAFAKVAATGTKPDESLEPKKASTGPKPGEIDEALAHDVILDMMNELCPDSHCEGAYEWKFESLSCKAGQCTLGFEAVSHDTGKKFKETIEFEFKGPVLQAENDASTLEFDTAMTSAIFEWERKGKK